MPKRITTKAASLKKPAKKRVKASGLAAQGVLVSAHFVRGLAQSVLERAAKIRRSLKTAKETKPS